MVIDIKQAAQAKTQKKKIIRTIEKTKQKACSGSYILKGLNTIFILLSQSLSFSDFSFFSFLLSPLSQPRKEFKQKNIFL